MRICQVLASQGEGGLEKHVRELAGQLAEAGHEVLVLGDADYLATLPAQVGRVPIRCDRSRRNPLLLLELLFKLRRCRCDIIHAQANKAASMVASLRRGLAAPTVGTLHNIKRNIAAFHRLDHVIAVSQQLAGPFPKPHCSVVYNGIAPPSCEQVDLRAQFGLPANRPVLLAAGHLVQAKGFDILLDAVDGLPLSLLIAGEGPERYSLEQRIKRMMPGTQCRLLGYRTDVATLMASADAVIISSRREGFSYVFSEALLLGARILATDVPVANEVLPAELIVPVGDAQALRNRLQALLDNMDGWSGLMEAPQASFSEGMTLKAMLEKTVAVYDKALAEN
ncbi:MAG: glycosyltransferase [Gammaproteobacteria bacterium]|nr:glycosyltransferase [Gammaproteobacteria bacterium]